MPRAAAVVAIALALLPPAARPVGPTVRFTLPPEDATPSVFGSLPFPCDLYFDHGRPTDPMSDGTLLAPGASMGLAADVARTNTATLEDAYGLMDGFGTTGYTLRRPVITAPGPEERASAARLLLSLVALGGARTSARAVSFEPPLSAPACAALVDVAVPSKGAGKVVRGVAAAASGRDAGAVRLRCRRAR